MFIIKRSDIPEINSIEIDGEIHDLGVLKDFRKHPRLAEYLPEESRVSFSWVRLKKGQKLSIHQHPVVSMIIVTEGQVETLGDATLMADAGDIIVIPANVQHGFIGSGKEGLWGLSIQFEGLGLYEDIQKPRVNFLE